MIEFKQVKGRNFLVITDAQLLSMPIRNFGGRPTDYNPKGGDREFAVVIEDAELAQQMAADNWNVKTYTNRDGRDYVYGVQANGEDIHYIKVKVKYRDKYDKPVIPPKITIRTQNNSADYKEADISDLDAADLINVNLLLNYSTKTTNGKTYTTAYLNRMVATMINDDFWFGEASQDEIPFDPD